MRRVELPAEHRDVLERAGRATGSWLYHAYLPEHPYLGAGVYEFGAAEMEIVARATAECHDLALAVLDRVIPDPQGWKSLGLPPWAWPWVQDSWDRGDDLPSLLVRFDFAPVLGPDGTLTGVKLLEANAQTPTTLPEAAGFQWEVVQTVWPGSGQWNAVWDRMVEAWSERLAFLKPGPMACCWHQGDASGEDATNVAWIAEAATWAAKALEASPDADERFAAKAFEAVLVAVDDLELVWPDGTAVADTPDGFARAAEQWDGCTYRAEGIRVPNAFLLEPWEQLLATPGAPALLRLSTPPARHPDAGPSETRESETIRVVEPLWKVCYSNKALLALLWERFPGNPWLLPTFADGPRDLGRWARKPFFSREGANVVLQDADGTVLAEGEDQEYGAEGCVWQQYVDLPRFPSGDGLGRVPVLGCWVIGDEACGLGIRETPGLITNNGAAFASHRITDLTIDEIAERGGFAP